MRIASLSLCVLLACTNLTNLLVADETSRKEYLTLITAHPEVIMPLGCASKGEIEIVVDPESMERIESMTGRDVGILKKRPSLDLAQ